MKKKIGIFTQYHMQPPHPRIFMEADILKNAGYDVEIIHSEKKKLRGLRYFLTFTFFNWKLISQYKKRLAPFDIVIIYDLALLPLCAFAKQKNIKVVYETIDHNVKYSFYELQKRFFPFLLLKPFLVPLFESIEKQMIRKYVSDVIVNSRSLKDSFAATGVNVFINYYASPFEDISFSAEQQRPFALLFIGRVAYEKGARLMLAFARATGHKLILIGDIDNVSLQARLKKADHLHYGKMDIGSLKKRIIDLATEYRLLGLSMVTDDNESSAMQELNKEIDYLAAGIPLIGNHRPLTAEKINAGCGVFYDQVDCKKMNELHHRYTKMSIAAKKYYASMYAKTRFQQVLLEVFGIVNIKNSMIL